MKTIFKMFALLSIAFFSSCAMEFGCPGSITSVRQHKVPAQNPNGQVNSATAFNSEDQDIITKGKE